MTTIYIINERTYSNWDKISTYINRSEWLDSINTIAKRETREENFEIAIYEIPENSETEIETGSSYDYRWEKHKKVNVNYALIPEDWELIWEEKVSYYKIYQIDDIEDENNWKRTDWELNYDTEEEAIDICSPAQYISL